MYGDWSGSIWSNSSTRYSELEPEMQFITLKMLCRGLMVGLVGPAPVRPVGQPHVPAPGLRPPADTVPHDDAGVSAEFLKATPHEVRFDHHIVVEYGDRPVPVAELEMPVRGKQRGGLADVLREGQHPRAGVGRELRSVDCGRIGHQVHVHTVGPRVRHGRPDGTGAVAARDENGCLAQAHRSVPCCDRPRRRLWPLRAR